MGITIKDAPLVEQLSGDEKIPISDGSNEPRTVNIEQIKEFANKDIEIPTKVSELENDSGYATSKEVEDAISKILTPDVSGQIASALVDYVKKVEGKGLSTNDFTNDLKAKLETIIPNDISELETEIGKLETALNTLVVGDASNAIESFNEIIAFLDGISDNEDLDSIIASIEQQIASKYSKPLSGIPKSDFSSDVQSSLNKAETALQEEQFKGTVVAVDTDESVDDPNIPSGSYDDTEIKKQIAGLESEVERKQENLISGQNIKTINGKSLLGEGDIEIERGDSYDDTELKNQIKDLETEVSKKADEAETDSKLSELGSKIYPITGVYTEVIKGSGTIDGKNIFSLKSGEKYIIRGKREAASSYPVYLYVKNAADNTSLLGLTIAADQTEQYSEYIPSTNVDVFINYYTGDSNCVCICTIESTSNLERINSELERINSELEKLWVENTAEWTKREKNAWINYLDGSLQSTTSPLNVFTLPAKSIDRVRVYVGALDTYSAFIAFYNTEDINTSSYIGGVQSFKTVGTYVEAKIPSDCKLVAVTNRYTTVENPMFFVANGSLIKFEKQMQDKFDDVSSEIEDLKFESTKDTLYWKGYSANILRTKLGQNVDYKDMVLKKGKVYSMEFSVDNPLVSPLYINILKLADSAKYIALTMEKDTTTYKGIVYCPEDCYIRMYHGKTIDVQVNIITSTADINVINRIPTEITRGTYISFLNGSLNNSESFNTYRVKDLSRISNIHVYALHRDSNSALIAFYDAEGNYLKDYSINSLNLYGSFAWFCATVPTEASQAIITSQVSTEEVVIGTFDNRGKSELTAGILNRIDSLEQKESSLRGQTINNINFPFPSPNLYGHLFIDKIYTNSNPTIPCQSVFDVAVTAKMGFKMIEVNVLLTSDGVPVTGHQVGANILQSLTDLDGNSVEVNVSETTFEELRANYRYKSAYAQYRTPITSLEEFLRACKCYNITPFVGDSYNSIVRQLTEDVVGKNYVAYGGNRTSTDVTIYIYSNATTVEDLISNCERVGAPFILGVGEMDNFSDDEIKVLLKEVHALGCRVGWAGCYHSVANNLRYYNLGVDITASGWDVPDFNECDQICAIGNTIKGFGDFGKSDGLSSLTNGEVLSVNKDKQSILSKASLHIHYKGELTIRFGKIYDVTLRSEGDSEVVLTSVIEDAKPNISITAVGNVELYSASYKVASVI